MRATTAMRAIATGGGYLWNYSLDLGRRAGESMANPDLIWVQAPGTPAMGRAYLRAYAATRDELFLEAVRDVAAALAAGQLGSGGWHYSIDIARPENNRDGLLDYKGRAFRQHQPGKPINPLYTVASTYDDNNTQNAIRFLLAAVLATKDSANPRDRAIRRTLDRAVDGLLRAQYENGAWPQRFEGKPHEPRKHAGKPATIPREYPRTWSASSDYVHHYTLNDGTQEDCIATLIEVAEQLGDCRGRAAVERAGDWLVRAQLPEPQPAWAQQYDTAMQPAWGRVFEPPAVVSNESGSALRALLLLYRETGHKRFLAPLGPALAWLERSQVSPGRWARLYELGTNRPIYGDLDGRIHYSLETVSEQRRTGYNWESDFRLPAVIAACRAALAGENPRAAKPKARGAPIATREAAACEAIAALDEQGRWIRIGRMTKRAPEEPLIMTSEYIRRAAALCDYLEAVGPKGGRE